MTEAKTFQRAPVARVEMLIRRPAAEVFAAFTEPEWLTRFWLYRASGPLEPGARVRWDFIVRGATTEVEVREWQRDERVVIAWSGGETVTFQLSARGAGQTFVSIENAGFTGDGDEVIAKALDSTGGFTIVLCELKALLEHGRTLGYGPDKFPDTPLEVPRPA